MNIPCPRSRLRIWSRETGSAVLSRVSLLILHTQTDSTKEASLAPKIKQLTPNPLFPTGKVFFLSFTCKNEAPTSDPQQPTIDGTCSENKQMSFTSTRAEALQPSETVEAAVLVAVGRTRTRGGEGGLGRAVLIAIPGCVPRSVSLLLSAAAYNPAKSCSAFKRTSCAEKGSCWLVKRRKRV